MQSFRKHGDLLVEPFSRRSFLKLGILGSALLALPGKAIAALEPVLSPGIIGSPGWKDEAGLVIEPCEERRLHLYSTNTGETFNRVYWADGDYIPEALEEINYLMRDYRANLVKEIDPNLLDRSITSTASWNATAPSTSSPVTVRPRPTRPCAGETAAWPATACTWPGWPSICGCPTSR